MQNEYLCQQEVTRIVFFVTKTMICEATKIKFEILCVVTSVHFLGTKKTFFILEYGFRF